MGVQIFSWYVGSSNLDALYGAAPYTKTSTGTFQKAGNITVTKLDRNPGSGITTDAGTQQLLGWVNGKVEYIARPTSNYWGLVKSSSDPSLWYIVKLWVLQSAPNIPKRKAYLPETGSGGTAVYYFGRKQNDYNEIPIPIFYVYNKVGQNYFEILTDSEVRQFPTGKPPSLDPWSGSPGGSNPNPLGGGGPPIPPVKTPPSSNDPIWGPNPLGGGPPAPPAGISANSGTATTIGNQPYEGGWQPDGSVYVPGIGTFRPPAATGGSGGGSRGAWVTAPDGTRVWLPKGTDFSKLKPPTPPEPKPETKIVVRMPKGYSAPQATAGTKPRMSQSYYEPLKEADKNPYTLGLLNGAPGILKTRTFVFPYIPQSIRYSDMGSEWQEIPRALNVPFVDWTRYKLMKVSMDFLVAAQFKPNPSVASTVSDGLQTDVTEELNLLRAMANSKNPVFLEGFDDILQMQLARSVNDVPRGMQFVINDLNIVAARRTIDPDTGLATYPSKIAAAQVSITLQEIPVETVTLVKLPPLDLGTPLVGKPGGGPGTGTNNLGLQSSVLTGIWEI